MKRNFPIKRIFIMVLFAFSLVQYSYAQVDMQAAVQREKMLRDQMQASADAMQKRVDQQQQQMAQQEQALQQQVATTVQNNSTQGGDMGNPLVLPLLLIVLVGLYGMGIYNGLVAARESVRNALSQIDVLLKRRHDLILNLVESAKGYMVYEKDTLEKVTKARQVAANAVAVPDKIQAENSLTSVLRGFMAVAENYPNLKADQNVLRLQDELAKTENQISVARQGYNNQVNQLNVSVQSFPNAIVAAVGHFEKAPFFKLESAEESQVPLVKI